MKTKKKITSEPSAVISVENYLSLRKEIYKKYRKHSWFPRLKEKWMIS